MELNVNSPAYFTQQFGVDDEVYRMCRETREFLQDKEYSEVLQVIGILPVAAPEELFENGTWSEKVRFLNHQAVAAVRVKLDYERYRDGSSTTRVHMMREAILQAGKRVKTRGKFAYGDFERDLHEFWGNSPVPVVGGVYSMYVEELGKYGAYQVLEADRDSVLYVVLDCLGDEPPKREALAGLKPLCQERFRYHHRPDMKYISSGRIPRDYTLIGVCPPVISGRCSVFAGDWQDGREYVYEHNWNQGDSQQRAEYKQFINSGDSVRVGGEYFRKNYGGLNMHLYRAAGGNLPVSSFPCLTFVEIEGPCPEVTGWIKGRSLIRTFRWKAPETEILDFRGTGLCFLELDVTGVKKIFLPDGVQRLSLSGVPDSELQIMGLLDRELDIELSLDSSKFDDWGAAIAGLRVRRLRLTGVGELDLAAVAGLFGEITALSVQGKPGFLVNFEGLGQMKRLRTLSFGDLFGYGEKETEILEKLPELRQLWMDSVPREAGLAVKKRFKNRLDSLEVRKLRALEWMKENLDNPFRHWDGSDFVPKAAFKSASAQYVKTKKRLRQAQGKEEIEAAVRDYGECFNRLNRRYEEFIETVEREDVFRALEQLYREELEGKSFVDLEEFLGILDDVRDDW